MIDAALAWPQGRVAPALARDDRDNTGWIR